MIKTKDVNKTYGEGTTAVRVVKDVSFSIDVGEIVAIMGPSGCGKTTLLHLLAGIESLNEGEVWIQGTEIHKLNENHLSRFRLENMGFVFQQYHLVDVLTAEENVALPLIARGLSPKEANNKARNMLIKVGLDEKATAYPHELSGGQCQRVAIARALVGEPKVVWADEPTGALDSKNAEQILGLLCKMNELNGTTIVIVTHDHEVANRAHRILYMENGRVLKERNLLND
ncbi:ABC transporter ATP-binding protein [Paenibacillus alkalitolerans]|uniref:ABC transporter ATP-binding protein n=1 Tax=Paenibacillus alkalitolerans TaxID=2799335 RepID=UPI0018F5EF4F|nr:ABC transporter ATP-binding protein [Paenibacillus alkalitolerans]